MRLFSVHDHKADRVFGLLMVLVILPFLILHVSCKNTPEPDSAEPVADSASDGRTKVLPGDETKFEALIGRWVRPDGGYIIEIRGIDPAGRVDAGYFNPGDINVSRAEAALEEGDLKLFIELRDVGYPGSTYNLVYNEQKEILVGVYFQAAMQQKFQVLFVRTPPR
jgi:hypothetical protein